MVTSRRRRTVKNSDRKLFMLLIGVPMTVVFLVLAAGWFFVALKTGTIPDSSAILVIFKHFVDLFMFISNSE